MTASDDNTARVWNITTGKAITLSLQHEDKVLYASFNLQGNKIATASRNGTARIWDVEMGTAITPPLKHEFSIQQVVFNPQGNKIATVTIDKKIYIWDIVAEKNIDSPLLKISKNHFVNHITFNVQGNKIAIASDDFTTHIQDIITKKISRPIFRHASSVLYVTFNKKGNRIATSSWDNTVRIWDVETGKTISSLFKHENEVEQIIFDPKNNSIVTISNRSARRWYLNTKKIIATQPKFNNQNITNFISFGTINVKGVAIEPSIYHIQTILDKNNTHLVTTTYHWLRWYELHKDKKGKLQATLIATRPLEEKFRAGKDNLKCIDKHCDGVSIVTGINTKQILYSDGRNTTPLREKAENLLKNWSKRLKINPDSL